VLGQQRRLVLGQQRRLVLGQQRRLVLGQQRRLVLGRPCRGAQRDACAWRMWHDMHHAWHMGTA
jgi:hypothetical protein